MNRNSFISFQSFILHRLYPSNYFVQARQHSAITVQKMSQTNAICGKIADVHARMSLCVLSELAYPAADDEQFLIGGAQLYNMAIYHKTRMNASSNKMHRHCHGVIVAGKQNVHRRRCSCIYFILFHFIMFSR